MNIQIGDIVRFLTDKLEGKVTGIINNTTVNVYCDDYGFEIPASVNDLVVIHTDAPGSTPAGSSNTAGKQKSISVASANTAYLAIVPDNFNNLPDSRYEFFIVNDTALTCLYTIAFREGDKYAGISAGNCNPRATSSLGSYSLKDIDAHIKAIHVQMIFFQKGQTTLKNAIETEIKINPANLCKAGSYKHNHWFNSISLLRPLEKEQPMETGTIDDRQLEQALKEKKDIPSHPSERRPQKQIVGNIVEIDLHADELLETTAGMANKDILEYQLDVFRQTLEEYKLRGGQKIVFIHGKGDGILRQRILWELQTKYKRHRHQDASFKQYGYGATMVIIK